MRPSLTIGIEEEYLTLDPETGEPRSHMPAHFLEQGKERLQEHVKPELFTSCVEVGTGVCADIRQARRELTELRRNVLQLAKENGYLLAATATHPIAQWREQGIYPDQRYEHIVDDLQVIARGNLVCGLHVHIGVEDPEMRIHIMNGARYFLPHLLALSANSPFWQGTDTGLASYRSKVFERFPRTNIPGIFRGNAEYEAYVQTLIKTKCIGSGKDIWWDIRPHYKYPTLEFRICDLPMRVDESIALAALIQATVAKLSRLHQQNQSFRLYRRALLMENKWRATRYGLEGKLIDFGKEEEAPERELMEEYLEIVDDVLDELGSREEVERIRTILQAGNGAQRQRRVFHETKDLFRVVNYIVEETQAGL